MFCIKELCDTVNFIYKPTTKINAKKKSVNNERTTTLHWFEQSSKMFSDDWRTRTWTWMQTLECGMKSNSRKQFEILNNSIDSSIQLRQRDIDKEGETLNQSHRIKQFSSGFLMSIDVDWVPLILYSNCDMIWNFIIAINGIFPLNCVSYKVLFGTSTSTSTGTSITMNWIEHTREKIDRWLIVSFISCKMGGCLFAVQCTCCKIKDSFFLLWNFIKTDSNRVWIILFNSFESMRWAANVTSYNILHSYSYWHFTQSFCFIHGADHLNNRLKVSGRMIHWENNLEQHNKYIENIWVPDKWGEKNFWSHIAS